MYLKNMPFVLMHYLTRTCMIKICLFLSLFFSIWNHLVQITKDGNKTVIITTHYIEEARQAHTVISSFV